MDTKLVLTWIKSDNSTEYFINGNSMGKDEAGFGNVLSQIAHSVNITRIILKYPTVGYNDGRDVIEHFPFAASYPDLLRITVEKNIRIEFMPEF